MAEHLRDFKGKLQVDGYSAYEKLAALPGMTLLGCWAHVGRKFEQASKNGQKEADPVLKEIQELYQIERQSRESHLNQDQRLQIRQEKCNEILNRIKSKLDELSMKNILSGSILGEDIEYTLKRWSPLCLYTLRG